VNHWKRRERDVIKKYGGKVNANSGAMWHSKGDGRHGERWVQEVKSTAKDTFKVTNRVIRKLLQDARVSSRTPMLLVNFIRHHREIIVVPGYCLELETLESDNTLEPYSHMIHFAAGGQVFKVVSGSIGRDLLKLA